MSNAFVDFNRVKGDESLINELADVQSILNASPSEKVGGNYQGSRVNIAIMKYLDYSVALIQDIVKDGLSYAKSDYYIYLGFGGKPSIIKTPNGMVKAMTALAYKKGFIVNINTGCIFKDYKFLEVKRNGLLDSIELINDPKHEVEEVTQGDILAPFCVVSLYAVDTKILLSKKVIIIRNGEFISAKSKSKSLHTHKSYPVPMAQKIALKRAVDEILSMMGHDGGDEYLDLIKARDDHNSDYELSTDIEEENIKASIPTKEEMQILKDLIKATSSDGFKICKAYDLEELEDIAKDKYTLLLKQLKTKQAQQIIKEKK